jgi:hypothetical protein
LREASLTYNFGAETLGKLPFTASLSIIGRNLWIIDKNTPYADPEAGLSSGNVQGYQSGAYLLLEKLEQVLNYSFKKKIMKNNINSVIYLAFVSCQSDDAYEKLK